MIYTLYAITNKAIYLIKLADEIDPKRTNPNIPNLQKKVLNHGLDNEVIGSILLTAKILFDKNRLNPTFNCHAALSISFELTKLLTEMQDIHIDLAKDIDNIVKQGLGAGGDRSLKLPSTQKLETRVDVFIKKADQVRNNIMACLKLLYNSGRNKKIIENIYSDIVAKHGMQSGLAQFVNSIVPVLKFIRNLRNAIEHPEDDNYILVKDFILEFDGTVFSPSIESINKDTPQPRMHITTFMKQMNNYLIETIEVFLVHLCISNMINMDGCFECRIMELPPEMRRHKNVRFSYVAKIQGQWVPFG